MESDGHFVITWHGNSATSTETSVFGRRFDATGAPQATEFQIDSFTAGYQKFPELAMDADRDFVVAWEGFAQDGELNDSIFAQRFAPGAVLDVDGNGSIAPLTDGLLVLRFLFGFTGVTLTGNAVDTGDCMRCDAAAILPYLQTLD